MTGLQPEFHGNYSVARCDFRYLRRDAVAAKFEQTKLSSLVPEKLTTKVLSCVGTKMAAR